VKLVFACLILLLAPARARALESGPVRAAIDGRHRFTVTVSAVPGTYCRLLRGDTPALCALPVDIRTGDSGSITLSDSVPVLERSFFRVERIPSAEPLDSDGDGLNDIEELAALPFRNPLNAAQTIPEADGMIYLADRAAFDAVSHRDNFPGAPGVREVKFLIMGIDTATPRLYFPNAAKHVYHYFFATQVLGYTKSLTDFNNETYFSNVARRNVAGSLIVYESWQPPEGGAPGIVALEFWPSDPVGYAYVQKSYDLVVRSMPGIGTRVAYHPASETQRTLYRTERVVYEAARRGGMHVIASEELIGDSSYTLLNPGVGFGRLILFDSSAPLTPRDIPIFHTLPNEITRTAGIITEVAQTPLSHINLKAKQNATPNAFIRSASTDPRLVALLGKYVRFEPGPDGFAIREATAAEVEEHLEALRPKTTQYPLSDLTQTAIRPLSALGFSSARAFGAKAANVAEMRRFLPSAMVPDGHAIPFQFYDSFMRNTGLRNTVEAMLADSGFQTNRAIRAEWLKNLQKAIKDAPVSESILAQVAALQAAFPADKGIRCRSSTNNEDLEGFSGAGLYDSFTHRPGEGHLIKSVKQVWASLWNERAFDERDFYRVDHLSVNMAVLAIPNFDDEIANGVGVTKNLIDPNWTGYYVNAQAGESLVTNPDPNAIPEEFLIAELEGPTRYEVQYVTFSNLLPEGQTVLTRAQAELLADCMSVIKRHFLPLYGGDPYAFAMEIEWKIDSLGKLMIKQARPWID
jgi:hypothetical protein